MPHEVPSPIDGASVITYDVRGKRVDIVGAAEDSTAILEDTFWPDGVLGVSRCDSDERRAADLVLVEEVVDADRITREVAQWQERSTAGRYELTKSNSMPSYHHDGATLFLLADDHSVEPAVVVAQGTTRTVKRTPTPSGARWLTRIFRDAATRYSQGDGDLILHSSAFIANNRAYLVIGDSGAGKSTTAVALARLIKGASWIGNDRIHVKRTVDHRYWVTACPLPLAINKGSLDVMGVTDFQGWDLHAGHPSPGSDWDQFHGEDKMKLSNGEVSRILGARVAAHGTLGGLIFPTIDLGCDFKLTHASDDFAEDVVGRNCFTDEDNLYGQDWLGLNQLRPPDALEKSVFVDHSTELLRLRCTLGGPADVARLAEELTKLI